MTSILGTAPTESGDPHHDATAVLRWAHTTFGGGLCVTASFGDATLAHVANVAIPGIEITLLDTGYLFAETEWFADHLTSRYGLSIRVVRPAPTSNATCGQPTPTHAARHARSNHSNERCVARRRGSPACDEATPQRVVRRRSPTTTS